MENRNVHILFIDDDPAALRLTEKRLIRAGYQVDIAPNGEAGLLLYQEGNYDVIVLDYRMPVYNGIEVIRKLVMQKNVPPIIMVTGAGDENTAVEAMKLGASDYISKDGGDGYLDLLPAVIEQVLQKRRVEMERQNALDKLERHNHDLALLHRASQMVTATLDLEEVIDQLLRVAAEIIGTESGSVWFLEEGNANQLKCQAHLKQSQVETPANLYLALGEGIAGWAAEHGETVIVNDVGDPRFSRQMGDSLGVTVKNIIAAPIQIRDITKGVLVVSNKQNNKFDEDDLFLIQTLASTAAIAIENARLFAEVQRLSITDELTGLFSRRHFFTIAEQEIQRASRYKHDFAIIMLDIDGFKNINDSYGHLAGDKVLKRLASDLVNTVRNIDFVSRYGGEEFVILLTETNLATATTTAERLREYIESHPLVIDEGILSITISAGVAGYSPDSTDIASLLIAADKALYQAKQAGRNKVISS